MVSSNILEAFRQESNRRASLESARREYMGVRDVGPCELPFYLYPQFLLMVAAAPKAVHSTPTSYVLDRICRFSCVAHGTMERSSGREVIIGHMPPQGSTPFIALRRERRLQDPSWMGQEMWYSGMFV